MATYPADSTGVWVDGKASATSGANQIFAKKYNKTLYMGQEQPPVYYISNPTAATNDQRKRYFPPAIAALEIANQNKRISAYEALLPIYNAEVVRYDLVMRIQTNADAGTADGFWKAFTNDKDYSLAGIDTTKPIPP